MFFKTRYVVYYHVVKNARYGQCHHVFPRTFTFKAKDHRAAVEAAKGKWEYVKRDASLETGTASVEFEALVKEEKEILGWRQNSTVLHITGLRNISVVNSK